MPLRTLLIWFALLLIAVVNGGIREILLVPRIGIEAGHALSSITLSAGIVLVTWLTLSWVGPASARQAWLIGLAWLVMTLVFEFGFGHYLRGQPWRVLLEDYNLLNGRIWLLVLLTTAVAPWAVWMRRD
ncbi:MAG: hypothetical protein ABJC74_12435 [Gemmatimonadota bacterium]